MCGVAASRLYWPHSETPTSFVMIEAITSSAHGGRPFDQLGTSNNIDPEFDLGLAAMPESPGNLM